MKRKQLFTILAIALMLVLSLSVLTACNKNKHEFSSEWKFDETNHWHECTTKKHSDTSEKIAHDFNAGEITKQPTEEEVGVKTFTCNTCGYKKTEDVAKLTHVHTFASEWSKDETNHWHAATCAHTTEKKDVEAHQWNDGVVTTPATEEAEGVKTYTCTVCEQTKSEAIEKLPHTHKYDMTTWVKTDEVGHYRPTTCGHEDKTKDFAEHTYTDDDDFDCIVCGYERVPTMDRTLELNVKDKVYTGKTNGIKPSEYSEWAWGYVDYIAYKAKDAPDSDYVKATNGGTPIAVGEYTVKVVTKGNAVYRPVEKTAAFAITKKGISLSRTYIVYVADKRYEELALNDYDKDQIIDGEEVFVKIDTTDIAVGSSVSLKSVDKVTLTGANAANYTIFYVDCGLRVEMKKIKTTSTVKVNGVENSSLYADAEIVYGAKSFEETSEQVGLVDYLDGFTGKNVTVNVYVKGNDTFALAQLVRVGNQYNYGGYTPATGGPGYYTYEFVNYYHYNRPYVTDYKWVYDTDSVELVFDVKVTEPTNIYSQEVMDAELIVRTDKPTYECYKIALDDGSTSKTIIITFSLDETNADCAAVIYDEKGSRKKTLTSSNNSYTLSIQEGEVYYVYVVAQRVAGTTDTKVIYGFNRGDVV